MSTNLERSTGRISDRARPDARRFGLGFVLAFAGCLAVAIAAPAGAVGAGGHSPDCGPLQAITEPTTDVRPSVARPAADLVRHVVSAPAGGTARIVRDIWATGGSEPEGLVATESRLYFTAREPDHGRELWTSDGTYDGTHLVRDIRPGPSSSRPQQLIVVGEHLYFSANDGTHGRELWVTDGTAGGTHRIELRKGAASSKPKGFVARGATVFFVASDGAGRQLWRTDGTVAGTRRLTSLPMIRRGPVLDALAVTGDEVAFATLTTKGGSLRLSDGTVAGTQRIKTFRHGNPDQMAVVGDTLFFSAGFAIEGGCVSNDWTELWVSDGTSKGTRSLGQIIPRQMVAYHSRLFFEAPDDNGHWRLWRSNGTVAGTYPVRPMLPADGELAVERGHLFWTWRAGQLSTGTGTTASAVVLVDIGSAWDIETPDVWDSARYHAYARLGNLVYFTAGYEVETPDQTLTDWALWQTDGTPGGTTEALDIGGDDHWAPGDLTTMGGALYFAADDGIKGRELWRYDP